MNELWKKCEGDQFIASIDTLAWRIVEDQGRSSTRKLVATNQWHDVLEKMLEETKSPLTIDLKKMHYLLFTPFRYPPLEYGSRFGKQHERGIFYAALELETALAEKAYYKLAFIRAYKSNNSIQMNFTSFQIKIESKQAIDLTTDPFDKHRGNISSPISYKDTQPLGASMRGCGVEVFVYYSARARFPAKNIGIFSPKAFGQNHNIERTFIAWNCFATQDLVEFSKKMSDAPVEIFNATDFFIDGKFPEIIKF